MKFSLLNAQSTRNKVDFISEYIVNDRINVAAMTETWLSPDDEQIVKDLTLEGYAIHHATRDGRRGGGVAIISESRYKPTAFPTQTFTSFETVSVKLSMKKATLILTTIYRPPEKPIGVFLSDFQTFLEEMLEFPGDIVISGDFNIHLEDRNNSLVARFHELLDSFSLMQHVDVQTHRSGRTLDLIITRNDEVSPLAPPATDTIVSDHFAIYCHFPIEKPEYDTRSNTSCKLASIDRELCRDDLRQMPCLTDPPEDLDTLVNNLNTELSDILERHAPKITRMKKIRPFNPWFDDDVLAAKKERRRCERIWLKTRSEMDKERFKASSNFYSTLLENKKTAFYSDKIQNCGSNQKTLFAIVNDIRRKGKNQVLPDHTSSETLANDFAKFF